MDPPKPADFCVVVMGKVGSGKSTVCNKLLTGTADGPFQVCYGAFTEQTKFTSHQTSTNNEPVVTVVDSPDVLSMGYTKADERQKFEEWKAAAPLTVPIVFVLTVRLDTRFTPDDYKLYTKYLQLLPEQCNIMLALTYTEGVKRSMNEELHSSPAGKLVNDVGGRYVAFSSHDTKENCQQKMTDIISNTKKLQIQPMNVTPLSSSLCSQTNPLQYRVVVMGKVGSGKSTVCNKLLTGTGDGPFKVFSSVGGEQTTQFSSLNKSLNDGSVLHVVDCPDVFNMGYTQHDAISQFEKWKTVVPGDIPTVFVFTVQLKDRFTPLDSELYTQYLHLVRKEYKQNTVAALTFTENLKNDLETEISQSPVRKFLNDIRRRYVSFSLQDTVDVCTRNMDIVLQNAKKSQTPTQLPVPSSPHSQADLPVYRVVVLGKVGSGKSTVCNKLLTGTGDGPFKVFSGFGGEQTTSFKCENVQTKGKIIHVVDSPDVFSMGYPQSVTSTRFGEWEAAAPWHVPTVFVFTVRIDQRFEPPDKDLYDNYLELVPEMYRRNIVVAFTFAEGFQSRQLKEEVQLSEVYSLPGVAEGRYVAFSSHDSLDKASKNREQILKTALIVTDRSHDLVQAHTSRPSRGNEGLLSKCVSYLCSYPNQTNVDKSKGKK